jgi:6-phosphofructokinase 1
MLQASDFAVEHLGPARIKSPLKTWGEAQGAPIRFVSDDRRLLWSPEVKHGAPPRTDLAFEIAGPREALYFDPATASAAILTAGGLCPGLNNVIRSVVMQLYYGYGVRRVWGVRHGYRGLHPDADPPPRELTPENVSDIHKFGGTFLGTSRGPGDLPRMVATLRERGIDMLFTLGGDGTQRGALALAGEAQRQGYPVSIVGIPKTIDNDIPYVYRTFGYLTAVEKAKEVIDAAHAEARSAYRGIGLVKVMGRAAGFIAAGAAITSQVVNYCLVPEVPFALEGEGCFLDQLERRMDVKGHAVIVVAEGAGQELMPDTGQRDASGNKVFGDIGAFLRDRIRHHFAAAGKPVDLKYIDPSYIIRGAPANSSDAAVCDLFARNAVHAAMAGKTKIVIGMWHGVYTHVPMTLASSTKRQLTEEGEMWQAVLKTTGQAARMIPRSTAESR